MSTVVVEVSMISDRDILFINGLSNYEELKQFIGYPKVIRTIVNGEIADLVINGTNRGNDQGEICDHIMIADITNVNFGEYKAEMLPGEEYVTTNIDYTNNDVATRISGILVGPGYRDIVMRNTSLRTYIIGNNPFLNRMFDEFMKAIEL